MRGCVGTGAGQFGTIGDDGPMGSSGARVLGWFESMSEL